MNHALAISQPHPSPHRTWTFDARETEIRGCLEALIKTQSPGGGGGWRRGKGGWWRGRHALLNVEDQ
ncbi:hypothetical protein HZ326_3997 [Fusarium oxysporum f. sp. albedinis]|nr:hypothetical protein HZ326_3997 [Fusarium oxysporum f. sp. albedinis]